jgi:hypothetical protein
VSIDHSTGRYFEKATLLAFGLHCDRNKVQLLFEETAPNGRLCKVWRSPASCRDALLFCMSNQGTQALQQNEFKALRLGGVTVHCIGRPPEV